MAVDPGIVRAVLVEELGIVHLLAPTYDWEVNANPNDFVVTVKMRAHNGDRYILEITADDYKEIPPLFEFLDPETGARGTPHAYPKGHDSFFHTSGPCICAPFNRKAYKAYIETGPHGDWSYGNWMRSTANKFNWATVTTLADMLSMIQTRLLQADLYKGRMA